MGVLGSDQAGKLLARLCREKGIDLTRSRFKQGAEQFCLGGAYKGRADLHRHQQKRRHRPVPPCDADRKTLLAACHDLICASYASRLRREDRRIGRHKDPAVL